MKDRLNGNYGHELPEIDFYEKAHATIDELIDAGFVIVEAKPK